MKYNIKSILKIGLVTLLVLILIDAFDRSVFWYLDDDEVKEIALFRKNEDKKKAYQKHFNSQEFRFPREDVNKIKIFKDQLLISRLTSTTILNSKTDEVVGFFNNPDNFDWDETTWESSETDYTFKFYNKSNDVIGKVWVCFEGCGMRKSMPFSPKMKFGGLSKTGRIKLDSILKEAFSQ